MTPQETGPSLERLLDEHDRIDRLCDALLGVADAEPLDIGALLSIRADLSAELDAHLDREDSFLYPAMLTRQGASGAVVAAFVTEFADLTRDWSCYFAEWSIECIAADRETFRTETVAMVSRLRDRVQRENGILYPTALRSGMIGLRSTD